MRAKKAFGQNFLQSKPVLQQVVDAAGVSAQDTVLEIGPGKGALTEMLLATGAHVIAVEIDADLVPLLEERFTKAITSGQLTLVQQDILKMNERDLQTLVGDTYKLVANIPYYITGEIIRVFLSATVQPTTMVLIVQKEVAQRIVARDGKESILSMSVKCYGEPKYVAKVPARLFTPKPKVDSAILAVHNINKTFFDTITEEDFFKVVKVGFAQKRKKVINNLATLFAKEVLVRLFQARGLALDIRAERLTLDDWKYIVDELCVKNLSRRTKHNHNLTGESNRWPRNNKAKVRCGIEPQEPLPAMLWGAKVIGACNTRHPNASSTARRADICPNNIIVTRNNSAGGTTKNISRLRREWRKKHCSHKSK